MITSRNIEDLALPVRNRALNFLIACRKQGLDILITSTYRDNEAQDALYAQGRTLPGKKVTKARGGDSMHNHRLAFDVVPMRAGKPVWDSRDPIWQQVGSIGESVGLEWGGRWTSLPDYPHFQWTGGLTLAQLKSGERPAGVA